MVLSGCGWLKLTPEKKAKPAVLKTGPVNSPITVADGSMIVRQKPRFHVYGPQEIHFCEDGGAATAITVDGTDISVPVAGKNWTIFSNSGGATVYTQNQGIDIIATGPSTFTLVPVDPSYPTDGPGAAQAGVTFSPASVTLADGTKKSLDCGAAKCKVRINYQISGAASTCP